DPPPWNWRIPELNREGEFRSIGSVLLWRAVRQSEEEGFHGRIGLHALPQAEPFYEKAGMESLGPDQNKQNLLYFELTRQGAQSLLQRGEQS
ncbi:MAG: GNAT family N-acetyltransferase, partial [Pirellulaceae bacterium]